MFELGKSMGLEALRRSSVDITPSPFWLRLDQQQLSVIMFAQEVNVVNTSIPGSD